MSNTSPTPRSIRTRPTRATNCSNTSPGRRYFGEHPDIASEAELEHRLKSGELKVALEIPTNFGKDLLTDKRPEISVWLDGAMPFRAETANGYVQGLAQTYLTDQAARGHIAGLQPLPVNLEERFQYNQAFKSVYQTIPSTIMLVLILIPAMMTAVGVAREKETGSIANFRSTPITGIEFLLGKQLPYVVIGLVSFLTLLLVAIYLFGVPVKGSVATLLSRRLCLHRRGNRLRPARLLLHLHSDRRDFHDNDPDPHRFALSGAGRREHRIRTSEEFPTLPRTRSAICGPFGRGAAEGGEPEGHRRALPAVLGPSVGAAVAIRPDGARLRARQ